VRLSHQCHGHFPLSLRPPFPDIRLPFINHPSYHSFGLSSSDIREIGGDFEPKIASSISPVRG